MIAAIIIVLYIAVAIIAIRPIGRALNINADDGGEDLVVVAFAALCWPIAILVVVGFWVVTKILPGDRHGD